MTVESAANTYNGTPAHQWAGRLAWLDTTPACQAAFPAIATASRAFCYDEWDIDVQTR